MKYSKKVSAALKRRIDAAPSKGYGKQTGFKKPGSQNRKKGYHSDEAKKRW